MDYFLTKYKHFHKGTKKMKSRKIKAVLSLVLTIALLAGNIGLLVPKLTAEAGTAGQYYVKVVVNVTDSVGDFLGTFDKCISTVYGRANNATIETDTVMDTTSEKNYYESTGNKTLFEGTYSYFPTKFTHKYKFGGGATIRKLEYTVTIYVGASSSSSLTKILSKTCTASSGIFSAANSTFTASVDVTDYPYVTNSAIAMSGTSPIYIPLTATNDTRTFSVSGTPVDQYGVAWVNNPTWSISNTSSSSSYATIPSTTAATSKTATFSNTPTSNYNATVTATWTSANTSHSSVTAIKPVTVYVHNQLTIKPNGGTYKETEANTVEHQYIGKTIALETPLKTGYSFTGWTKSGSGTLSSDNTTYTISTSNDTITANWTPNDYTLSFDANGGSVDPASKTVTFDNAIGELPEPVRTGYDFTGWYTAQDGGEAVSDETVYTTAYNSTVYAHWTPNNDSVIADKTAIDFGLPVVIDILNNDILKSDAIDASIAGIGAVSSDPTDTLDTSVYQNEYASSSGTFTVNADNTVTYTPNGFLSEPQVAYVAVSAGGKYVYSRITVVPATTIYYEDDANSLISYQDGVSADNATGTWGTVGASKTNSVTQNLSDDVYGYDDIYADATNSTYSMGSSHIVSVSAKNNPNSKYSGTDGNSWPTAQFTFAGTGFDIVSLTDSTTGAINVRVFSGTDTSASPIYNWIVDTYYGYELQNGEWVVSENSGTLYQIPVISASSLTYGTYTVQIIPMYSSRLDHAKNGSYDFYLDAVRIYNPCGDDQDANDIYAEDGEMIAADYELRDLLITAGSLGEETNTGAVYINPSLPAGSLADYKNAGPKNEVYLDKGQAVAFGLTANSIPDRVLISAHAPTGTAASLRFGDGSGSYTDVVTIATATTLYYEIPVSASDWEQNADGHYTTKQPIIIANGGDGLLALCRIKCTYAGSAASADMTAVTLTMNRSAALRSSSVAITMAALSPEDEGLFVPESVTAEDVTEAVVSGESIAVTITTTDDVARLTVNGEDATCTEETNDTKTWTFTYAADETGEQTLELVAYDEYGYASENTTLTFTVESKVEHFFNQLKQFIKAILELIRTIAKAAEF